MKKIKKILSLLFPSSARRTPKDTGSKPKNTAPGSAGGGPVEGPDA